MEQSFGFAVGRGPTSIRLRRSGGLFPWLSKTVPVELVLPFYIRLRRSGGLQDSVGGVGPTLRSVPHGAHVTAILPFPSLAIAQLADFGVRTPFTIVLD